MITKLHFLHTVFQSISERVSEKRNRIEETKKENIKKSICSHLHYRKNKENGQFLFIFLKTLRKLFIYISENVKKSKSLNENVFNILDKMEELQNQVITDTLEVHVYFLIGYLKFKKKLGSKIETVW